MADLHRKPTHKRPPWLLALGRDGMPPSVVVQGKTYALAVTFKHDAWAATGLYECGGEKIICKYGRRVSLFGVPMGWLGRRLAARESRLMLRLADLPGVPCDLGPVKVDSVVWPQALARGFIEGDILSRDMKVADDFFPALRGLIREVHARDIAYVDLNKPDNILVGTDGRPYLIDFQISFVLSQRFPWNGGPTRWLLKLLQESDEYHLRKHVKKFRPDQLAAMEMHGAFAIPWPIRLHRFLTVPLRQFRRRLLVWLGVRSGEGRADSETAPPQGPRTPAS